jgi:hypothetical protein
MCYLKTERRFCLKLKTYQNFCLLNTDITIVRFSDRAKWGGYDKFTVIAEEMLQKNPEKSLLGSVLAVYRNLREKYEFRLRYDEAGQFFIKEMELKRKYREVLSEDGRIIPKRNDWTRRNFSLSGMYHAFSNYEESLLRPIFLGFFIVSSTTILYVTQSNPNLTLHSARMYLMLQDIFQITLYLLAGRKLEIKLSG